MRTTHNFKVLIKYQNELQEVIVKAVNAEHAKNITQYQYYPHTSIKFISVVLMV